MGTEVQVQDSPPAPQTELTAGQPAQPAPEPTQPAPEVADLQAQLATMAATMRQMQDQLREAQERAQQEAEPDTLTTDEFMRRFGLRPEQVEAGGDMLNAVYRVAELTARQHEKELRKYIDDVREQERVGAFLSTMDTLVPRWRQLNTDPAFISWLTQSGRKEILSAARNSLDGARAAQIFQEYVSKARGSASQPAAQAGQPVPGGPYSVPLPADTAIQEIPAADYTGYAAAQVQVPQYVVPGSPGLYTNPPALPVQPAAGQGQKIPYAEWQAWQNHYAKQPPRNQQEQAHYVALNQAFAQGRVV